MVFRMLHDELMYTQVFCVGGGDKDDDVHAEFDPPRAEPSSSSFPVDKPLSKQA